jgi:hypothetical protein
MIPYFTIPNMLQRSSLQEKFLNHLRQKTTDRLSTAPSKFNNMLVAYNIVIKLQFFVLIPESSKLRFTSDLRAIKEGLISTYPELQDINVEDYTLIPHDYILNMVLNAIKTFPDKVPYIIDAQVSDPLDIQIAVTPDITKITKNNRIAFHPVNHLFFTGWELYKSSFFGYKRKTVRSEISDILDTVIRMEVVVPFSRLVLNPSFERELTPYFNTQSRTGRNVFFTDKSGNFVFDKTMYSGRYPTGCYDFGGCISTSFALLRGVK